MWPTLCSISGILSKYDRDFEVYTMRDCVSCADEVGCKPDVVVEAETVIAGISWAGIGAVLGGLARTSTFNSHSDQTSPGGWHCFPTWSMTTQRHLLREIPPSHGAQKGQGDDQGLWVVSDSNDDPVQWLHCLWKLRGDNFSFLDSRKEKL